MRRPIRTSLALFRSPWYTLGILVAMAGWGFHVGALALAPISLVQSVIAGGLVLLTVTADRLFAHEVSRREWVGVGLAALGLAFLAATLEGTGDEAHSDYETLRIVIYLFVVSGAAVAIAALARDNPREGVMLGASAGLFWAASDTVDQGALRRARRRQRSRDPVQPAGAGDRRLAPRPASSSRRAACRSERRCR